MSSAIAKAYKGRPSSDRTRDAAISTQTISPAARRRDCLGGYGGIPGAVRRWAAFVCFGDGRGHYRTASGGGTSARTFRPPDPPSGRGTQTNCAGTARQHRAESGRAQTELIAPQG